MSHFNRISRTVYSFIVLLLCAVFIHAPAQADVTFSALDVTPLNPTLSVGQTQAFAATGAFSGGTTQPLLSSPVTAMGAGSGHTCALLAGGGVECWGNNSSGQLGNNTTTSTSTHVTVVGITTATAVTAGDSHSCAVLASGAVQCWGSNYSGQLGNGTYIDSKIPVTVSGISTATALTAGSQHTCALLASGEVQCWGWNVSGQLGNGAYGTSYTVPIPVLGISTATALSAENQRTCALLSSGAVQCWGNGSVLPVAISGISTATEITSGVAHSCARLASGTVQCWGDNYYGQLGDGTTTSSNTPVMVSGISTATALSGGGNHTCAVLAGGAVQCWGSGLLGNGVTIGPSVPNSTPVNVIGISTALALEAGLSHTCALLTGGAMQCWGDNQYGQLGVPLPQDSAIPVAVNGISSATALAAGSSHSCAVLVGGQVQCWGGGYGYPVTVSGISTATAVAAGNGHSCALLASGAVQCWGLNTYGELGNGTTTNSITPVSVVGISTATALSVGDYHSCALLASGEVQCWGYNSYGQLGNGTTTQSTVPVTVSGISTATAVAMSSLSSCALLSSGAVQCWGRSVRVEYCAIRQCSGVYSVYGTTILPSTVSGINTATAITTGSGHHCALLAGGEVQCWGNDYNGQVGNGESTVNRIGEFQYGPVTVSGISTATAVAAGGEHTCALLASGEVQCWGGNGLLGNGTTGSSTIPVTVSGISTATALATNSGHTCALLTSGAAQCWGSNSNGQLGTGGARTLTSPGLPVTGTPGIVWSSSDPSVASITDSGMATALSLGNTIITATAGGISASTTLTVDSLVGLNYTLATTTQGNGSGTVVGAGVYTTGQVATVTATANTGSSFSGWTGANAAECATGYVLMSADKFCTATFTLNTYTLSLSTAGTGTGTVSGAGTFNYGTYAPVIAIPNSDSVFAGWSGPDGAACTASPVLMNADKSCTATFTLKTYTLSLVMTGTGSGTVSGSGVYTAGQTVTITATANSGSTFTGWTGGSGCAIGSVFMIGSITCTATFTLNTDLSLSLVATPAYVQQGETVSYVLSVTNNGALAATAVTVTGTLPTCTLGSIASGATVICPTISVIATLGGTLTQTMTVNGAETDTVPGNNTASVSTTVFANVTTLSSINVTPVAPTLNIVGQTQAFTATGTFSDGSTQLLGIPVKALTAGENHTCALLVSGAVQCWGNNTSGQLGNGTISTTSPYGISTPVKVIGISTATALVSGWHSNCALLASGEVQCWGSIPGGWTYIPVTVSGISTATALAGGYGHTCALLANGAVQCWGSNAHGQLGNGTTTGSSTPVTVIGISGTVTALAAGNTDTCALLASGAVQCWGNNYYGQLGNGTTTNASTPVSVSGISTATALVTGQLHTCALLSSGAVQCWGRNSSGELGNGTTTASSTPVTVSGISTATALAAGYYSSCALLASGAAQCWGTNTYGVLGNGTTSATNIPVSVSGISTATALVAGEFHACALLASSAVQCWGRNTEGQLGNGVFGTYPTPLVSVLGTPGVVWSSSDPSVASITANGLATSLSLGTTIITATAGNLSTSTTLTVSSQTYTLSIVTQGNGSGSVSGAGVYNDGQTATVTATANTGSIFSGWTGANAAECATGSVLMNADKSCTATFTLAAAADLTPTALTATQSATKVTVKDTAKNQGTVKINSVFTVGYYLSTDTVYQAGSDMALASSTKGSGTCTRSIKSLGAGSSSAGSATCYKPTTAQKGVNYYVLVVDDAGNVITESNETNNARSTSGTVRW